MLEPLTPLFPEVVCAHRWPAPDPRHTAPAVTMHLGYLTSALATNRFWGDVSTSAQLQEKKR